MLQNIVTCKLNQIHERNMKNLPFIFVLAFISFGISLTATAQDVEGDIFLEGGFGYGSKIQSLAIQAGGLYTINSEFRVSADGIYHFPGNDSHGLEFTWLEVNTNGHYLFINQEDMKFYFLGGLNFAKLFSDHDDIRLPSGDSTEQLYIGLNIGAGYELSLGSVLGFIEGKYALSSAHQLVLTGGVRIPI